MKLTKIDALLLPQHSCLGKDDECFFFGEYTAKAGYHYSELNQLIFNFKKDMSKKGLPEWRYKVSAISYIAKLLYDCPPLMEINYTWVPVPSSKIEAEDDHDDRLWQTLCELQSKKSDLDIRKLVLASKNRLSAHAGGGSRCVTDHMENWAVDTIKALPSFNGIIIFDDVITTGASFKAAKNLLRSHFPGKHIVGIFIGRTVSSGSKENIQIS